MSETSNTPVRNWLQDYRMVWRWHFYAGLLTLPFVIVLSVTGAIYLFKPEIEAWNDRHYDNLSITQRARVSEQVSAAVANVPDSTPGSYELPQNSRSAGRVTVRKNGVPIRVYVHPETLEVLNTVPENDRLMRILFRLHGELLMGDRGSNLVELASSWTILMIVSGLYLWWPRNHKGFGGVLYPRWWKGSRLVWRDLHSVTGVWISALALFLLVTGLPWAKFWGNYFKTVRAVTGTSVVQQDWTTGSEGSSRGARVRMDSSEHGGHGTGKGRGEKSTTPVDLTGFDRVVATMEPLQLPHPVVIAPPGRGSDQWTAKSMTQNRPYRVNLVVSGKTGEILSRENFEDRHWVDQVVGTGVAAHEGQLFGWPNQMLGLFTAIGLILLSVSGVVMWWKRREQGVLGAPQPSKNFRVSWGVMLIVLLFAIYLPLFGASLVVVLAVEKLLLSRIPGVRDWLGLRHRAAATPNSITRELDEART